MNPIVSVIIPAYNTSRFIKKTILSVTNQTYQNLEIIVIDDCSQDETVAIVKSLAQLDSRIILKQNSINQGVAAARNTGIQISQGDYIAPLDADDLWHPQKIEKQLEVMLQADDSVGLVYTWLVSIDEEDTPLTTELFPKTNYYIPEGKVYFLLAFSNFASNPSCHLIRRSCFDNVGYYSSKLREMNAQGCEDWDLCLRIAKLYQFKAVPEFLVGYREVFTSMSSNWRTMEKSYKIVMESVEIEHSKYSQKIFRWSESFFYQYLFIKTFNSGHYLDAIICLSKYIRSDFLPLFRTKTYTIYLTCILKILFKPFSLLIWSNHKDWMKFRKNILLLICKRTRKKFSEVDLIINQKEIKLYKWSKPDSIIRYFVLKHRWDEIIKISNYLTEATEDSV